MHKTINFPTTMAATLDLRKSTLGREVKSSPPSSSTSLPVSSTFLGRRASGRSTSPTASLLLGILFLSSISFFHFLLHDTTTLSQDSNGKHNKVGNHILHESLKDFKDSNISPSKKVGPQMSSEVKVDKSELPLQGNDNDDPGLVDRIREDPIPNPPMSDGNQTFSACLLVMDDNHRLVEWMAYHYHVLPLRHLIIAVDPRSRTSPTSILNRWRNMGVYIEEWDDQRFMKPELAKNVIPDDAELQVKRDRHRMRQKNFYRQCLQDLKHQGRTWVTLIDTDEFLTYNHKGGEDYEQWERQQQIRHDISKFRDQKRIRPFHTPPTTAQSGALIEYIRQEASAGNAFFDRSCISCPRLQFGAKESSEMDRQKNVPHGLNADRLDTLRFRKHAERQDFVKNGLSKSIVDVSRVETFPRIQTLHRPIKTICTAPWKDEWTSGLRINHYLGSWEAYSFRDDSRRGGERSFEGWAFKAQDADETDDNIRPWIGGFVAEHGQEKAQMLLQGAGLPRGYQDPSGKNWTIMFLDEILSVNETTGNDMRIAFDNFVRDFHFNKKQSTEGLL